MFSISQAKKMTLQQILLREVNETYGKYEAHINHQHKALNTMLEQIKNDPESSQNYMKTFKDAYEINKSDMSLGVYYRGIVGKPPFGQSLSAVYLDVCHKKRSAMEVKCSILSYLFCKGLMALMAYTIITEDDEDKVAEIWSPRMAEIQNKMNEMLDNCDGI